MKTTLLRELDDPSNDWIFILLLVIVYLGWAGSIVSILNL